MKQRRRSGANVSSVVERTKVVDKTTPLASVLWWKVRIAWLLNIVTGPTKDTQTEAKVVKEVPADAVEKEMELSVVVTKHEFWRAIRITAWFVRFLPRNC